MFVPMTVYDRMLKSFRKNFTFSKLRICEVSRNLNPRENFPFYSITRNKYHINTQQATPLHHEEGTQSTNRNKIIEDN